MNVYYNLKSWSKRRRWELRRMAAGIRWGPEVLLKTPAVLGNAMPKSGSHLIIQVLQGLTRLGPFINPGFPPVNRSENNSKLPEVSILGNIRRMRPGDIAYGYIGAKEPFISALTAPGRATIFVYRDPRDMIVSHVFYATQMHTGHGMHQYYNQELHSMEERINAAIQGVEVPGAPLTPVKEKYEAYLGWLKEPEVLCLRFEDLILDRQVALGKILDYLETRGFKPKVSRSSAIEVLEQAIIPKKSGTFRKGKPGNWQEHFTELNKTLFKEKTGNLLVQLGYETGQDW